MSATGFIETSYHCFYFYIAFHFAGFYGKAQSYINDA